MNEPCADCAAEEPEYGTQEWIAWDHGPCTHKPRRPYVPPALTSSPVLERAALACSPTQFAFNEDPTCADALPAGSS